ncbi:ABC transporter ATP-binding protein [Streptomyces sp. AgN23]|uniref:ABC transporter ATP-binding protein n=1 Tax=Streptomyces sp. AgN23 TaxID=1188315 RepID=UPI001B3258B0|nr:ABC transporter ATP-binding protein [Streptomyces sp. AgN23]QTI87274.1 ABC transporter ATP-binding protein [Streptomyces sp. AgN23]
MLEITGLTVRYGAVAALREVSLTVGDGEFVTVVGANGAGKSTLMRTAAGLLRPASGTVRLAGRDITRMPPEHVVREGLSLVPEGRHIFTTLTVADNLRLGLLGTGRRTLTRRDRDRVTGYFPALEKLMDRRASTLSGGEQQMVAIARAMLAEPRMLLLDEPSLGLAPLVVDTVLDALSRLHRDGVSVLLVEQNARRAIALADHVHVLHKGVVRQRGADDTTGHGLAAVFLRGPGTPGPDIPGPAAAAEGN